MNPIKIATIRKQQGLTQEELAEKSGVTLRTIQRIENGKSAPRSYTIKAIAQTLNIPFADLLSNTNNPLIKVADQADKIHFLKILVISCFTYLLIPFLHFLIPTYLLRKKPDLTRPELEFARKLLRNQVYWVVALNLAMLLTVSWNLTAKHDLVVLPRISYLSTLFVMYLANAIVISIAFFQLKKINIANGQIFDA